jgi:hypothetical protein
MNKNLSLTLSIAAIAAAASLSQPAMAQEKLDGGAGARFIMAPNTWGPGGPSNPHHYVNIAPRNPNPMMGQAPKNMLLGTNPSIFQKPVAPPPQPIIAHNPFVNAAMQQAFGRPLTTQPVAAPPQVAYRAAFGNPLEVKPPVVASLPKPQTTPPMHEDKAQAARSNVGRRYSNGLSGKMIRPGVQQGTHAIAASLPPVASYGSKGYTPGTIPMHASNGSGIGVGTAVSGKLLNH